MLDSLHIKNFRCFEDLTIPSLGRVNLIVGRNNSGKSTLLEAISVYAGAGQEKILDDILEKRGDTYLTNENHPNFARPYIFHDNNIPNASSCLEIGNASGDNSFQIIPDDLVETIKAKYNVLNFNNQNLAIPAKNHISFHTINIRNNKLVTPPPFIPVATSPTDLVSENNLALIWDEIFLNMDDSVLKQALQIIEKSIVNIAFVPTKDPNKKRIAVVKILGKQKAVSVKSLGDGMSRLLQIFLYTLKAKSGFLLLDEFENGLHYSIQEEVWEKLFRLAKELDIQVFATTHSRDTLEAFAKVAGANKEVEGKLITLGKNAGKTNRGRIISHVYNEEELEWIVNTRTEIR